MGQRLHLTRKYFLTSENTAVFSISKNTPNSLYRINISDIGCSMARLISHFRVSESDFTVSQEEFCSDCFPEIGHFRTSEKCLFFYTDNSDVTVCIFSGLVTIWIGLHLFNDDTRPSGHISRPSQVGFSHSCLCSINEVQWWCSVVGINSTWECHHLVTDLNKELYWIYGHSYQIKESSF